MASVVAEVEALEVAVATVMVLVEVRAMEEVMVAVLVLVAMLVEMVLALPRASATLVMIVGERAAVLLLVIL